MCMRVRSFRGLRRSVERRVESSLGRLQQMETHVSTCLLPPATTTQGASQHDVALAEVCPPSVVASIEEWLLDLRRRDLLPRTSTKARPRLGACAGTGTDVATAVGAGGGGAGAGAGAGAGSDAGANAGTDVVSNEAARAPTSDDTSQASRMGNHIGSYFHTKPAFQGCAMNTSDLPYALAMCLEALVRQLSAECGKRLLSVTLSAVTPNDVTRLRNSAGLPAGSSAAVTGSITTQWRDACQFDVDVM